MGFPDCPKRELTPNELLNTSTKDSGLLACGTHPKTFDLEITEQDSSVSGYWTHHFFVISNMLRLISRTYFSS